MSTLIIILIVLGALILIPLIGGTLVSKHMRIEREVVINKPVNEVYDYVKYLRNAEKYNKWVMTDPQMKKEYAGTDGTVGFVYKWHSENKQVGQGEQEIVAMQENKKIDYELRFIRPYPNTAYGHMVTEPAGQATRVRYIFEGPSNYMMRVMQFMLNIKKMLGKDMAITLANLKNTLEK